MRKMKLKLNGREFLADPAALPEGRRDIRPGIYFRYKRILSPLVAAILLAPGIPLILAMVLVVFLAWSTRGQFQPVEVGAPAPEISAFDLDGTPNKGELGANAILAVSLAAARAAAAGVDLPTYRYLGGTSARTLPTPCFNVVNGGAHAANSIDTQEFMLVPGGAPTYAEALRAGTEVYQSLKGVLAGRGLPTNVGDEGGFAPDLASDREVLDVLSEAIEAAGYAVGDDISFALDVAASELYSDGTYSVSGQELDSEAMVAHLAGLAADYPIVSIEDGLDEADWDGWKHMTDELGDKVQIVGDDLLVTNVTLLQKAIDMDVANAILVKVNQIGSLSETLHAMELAERNSYGSMVSHRSGETEDSFIAHLAVATNAGQIKTGAPARGERTAKYNQLLRIEERLGADARFAGWDRFRKFR